MLKIEQEVLINQYGQGIAHIDSLISLFSSIDKDLQKVFLMHLLTLIQQSKPRNEDIELAIQESKLRATYTPCVMLKKGVATHNLMQLINLPENEQQKTFILLLSLFKIAYQRRYQEEKNNTDKWWYWDLSDNEAVNTIISKHNSNSLF
ncbi:MAG: DUF5958 family protein [Dysgonamonadaceae bacterium]